MNESIVTTKGRRVCTRCVVSLMELRGGSFVKALAFLWQMGDEHNRSKAVQAWADYFLRYADQFAESGQECPEEKAGLLRKKNSSNKNT